MLTLYRNNFWPFIDTENYEIRPKKSYLEKLVARKREIREAYLSEAERMTSEIKELEEQLK